MRSDDRHARHLGAFFLATTLFGAIAGAYAFKGSAEATPFDLPFERQLQTRLWVPEAWKFFTKDPRSERPLPFRRAGGAWVSASIGPNAEPSNAFGLDRTGRAQGVEIGLLLDKVPASAWTPCDASPASCLDAPSAVEVRNPSPSPTLCGEVGLALQKPVPWAWSRSGHPVVMPSHVARLEVRC